MHAVVLQKMGVGLDRAQVVDRDDLDIGAPRLDDATQDIASDPTEAIDCHFDHDVTSGEYSQPSRIEPMSASGRNLS